MPRQNGKMATPEAACSVAGRIFETHNFLLNLFILLFYLNFYFCLIFGASFAWGAPGMIETS